jgi:hypothetical protein
MNGKNLYPKGRKSLKWVEKKEGEPRGNLPIEVKNSQKGRDKEKMNGKNFYPKGRKSLKG